MRRVFELRPRLATTLVATISVLIFFFFPCSKKFSVDYFSHRRAARINKKYLRQLLRVPRGVRNFVLVALQSVAVNLMGVLIKVNIWLL